ncbi:MAG: hypothetical protein WCQ86_07290 [Bacteroidaceae bacterium]
MKRFAAHFISFDRSSLPLSVCEIIERDISLLGLPLKYSATSESYRFVVVEIEEGRLLRLMPFTEEIESTEWHNGTLQLKYSLDKGVWVEMEE